MSSQLDRIESKVDHIDQRMDSVDVKLAVYNEQLAIHVAGVKEAREENKALRAELHPIKKDWVFAKNVLKFLGAAMAGALAAKSLGLF
jgi:septation ring formation regulator EzrA